MDTCNSSEDKKLIEQQHKMDRELSLKSDIEALPYYPNSTQFIIPSVGKARERLVTLIDSECEYKKFLFVALYTAYYQIFMTEDYTENKKGDFNKHVPIFMRYLNATKLNDRRHIQALKDYETHRVNDGIKPQSTGLAQIRSYIRLALKYPSINKLYSSRGFEYLETLTMTKTAPSEDKESITLVNWFAYHGWLRRDDIGIGNDLYNRLASPKALITSLRVTAETSLLEIQHAKKALMVFFKDHNITMHDIPTVPNQNDFDRRQDYKKFVAELYSALLNKVCTQYYQVRNPDNELTLAVELVIYALVKTAALTNSLKLFKARKSLPIFTMSSKFSSTYRFTQKRDSLLFSYDFLQKLARVAHSVTCEPMPTCEAEHLLFQWLMACQSVAASDIPRLRPRNFRFLRRVNGQVTHIESDYFKTRASTTHALKNIEANTHFGKAFLNFFHDQCGNRETNDCLTLKLRSYKTKHSSKFGAFINFISTSSLRHHIDVQLAKNKATSVFIDAIHTIGIKGIEFNSTKFDKREQWLKSCDTPCYGGVFGLASIKTTSVHAKSDTFSPTQLMNYNSHTDSTERKHYLNKHNEKWLNNCGRITRAVMLDLYVNVYRPSKQDQQQFNSEFMRASEQISIRSQSVLAVLKLTTGKADGRVDELGFEKAWKVREGDLPDSLYLVDSPETVMRLRHYIAEVERCHRKLAASAPEYLLFTVLPTAEWIASLFNKKAFTRSVKEAGDTLFTKFSAELPPLFTSYIGG